MVTKGTFIYCRSKRHDFISDFLPPSMSEFKYAFDQVMRPFLLATSPVIFSTLEDGKIVKGFARVPDEGPGGAFGGSMSLPSSVQPVNQLPAAHMLQGSAANVGGKLPPYPLFPPGLIPGMVRKMQIDSGVPYSPMRMTLPPGKPPLPPPPMLNQTLSDSINPASPPPKLLRNNSISSSNTVDGGFGFSVPVDEDSPYLKRVRRMKERMKQMHQWWNEVMLEGDDDASQSQEEINNNNTNTNTNNAIQDDFGEADEQVCVERLGECLCINFKCQCTKGYQILLSGNKIYYKLI